MSARIGNSLAMAWRQARRDLAAGEVRILIAALVLAVLAITAVGLVTDRAARALELQANQLLGGDAVWRGDAEPAPALLAAARTPGLQHARTVELDSMVRVGEAAQMAQLLALGPGFPLRGSYRVAGADGSERDVAGGPPPGSVWIGRSGAQRLGARIGDPIQVGYASLRVGAIVVAEPDAALDYFDIAPKVYLALQDLAQSGLLQPGARVRHRLIVAGEAGAVERFGASARSTLGRGQRLETAGDARPEIRSALDRAERFLSLASMLTVVLAAIAVAMAARRHSARHLQGAAVMRCLGASQRQLVLVQVGELLLLGLLACVAGVVLAYALQWGVGLWLAQRLAIDIPPAGIAPMVEGAAAGLLVLLAFGAPPVLALRRVPALRVLRRDLDPTEPTALVVGLAAFAGLAALLWWKAGSPVLAAALLGGIAGALAVLGLLAWAMIVLVRRLRPRLRGALRYGLANVSRRPATSIAQVAALGLGLTALLLLGFVRSDLLSRWQVALQADAPNRFIINVQDAQLDAVRARIRGLGGGDPQLFPMVRARLLARNDAPVTAADYAGRDERTRRQAEREFNLSTSDSLRGDDNRVTAGRFWSGPTARTELSVEEEFATRLGWKIGDSITFDIAGQELRGRITSLRKVDWESFRPNFFVLVSPGALDAYPASWITAARVPGGDAAFTPALVREFPNLSVIDVDAVLAQVRRTADQVSQVVQVVFWFALAAGVLVLLAAISASQDERLQEAAVMRVLGGSRSQLRAAQASEFAMVGLLAGLVAAVAASVLSGIVAREVFDLPWQPDWAMAAFGGGLGMLAALLAGLAATRRALDAPPTATLRALDA